MSANIDENLTLKEALLALEDAHEKIAQMEGQLSQVSQFQEIIEPVDWSVKSIELPSQTESLLATNAAPKGGSYIIMVPWDAEAYKLPFGVALIRYIDEDPAPLYSIDHVAP